MKLSIIIASSLAFFGSCSSVLNNRDPPLFGTVLGEKDGLPTDVLQSSLLYFPSSMIGKIDPEIPFTQNLQCNFLKNSNGIADSSSQRNEKKHYLSTGTTIAGISCRSFCILGADTRATTSGSLVADTRADKLHVLARNVVACGAGTSADLQHLTRLCRYSLRLTTLTNSPIYNNADQQYLSLSTDEDVHLPIAVVIQWLQSRLFQLQGHCQANLIVGGVDDASQTTALYAVHPHGSVDPNVPFAALGSGGLAAMSVLEQSYRPDLTLEEGIDVVTRAIRAGIQNDLGSGSQIDLCILRPGHPTEYRRGAVAEEELDPIEPVPASARSFLPSSPGVNGFGNRPLQLEAVKHLFPIPLQQELQRKEELNQILERQFHP